MLSWLSYSMEHRQLVRRLLVLWLVGAVSWLLYLITWVVFRIFDNVQLLPTIITPPVADAVEAITGLLAGAATLMTGGVALYKVLRYKADQRKGPAND
jgi:hypothetical protein